MTSRHHFQARPPRLGLGLLAFSTFFWLRALPVASAREVAVAEPALRYPFDPVCPWGRVADGQGILVRCLDAAEAQRLAATARTSSAASPAAAPPATVSQAATSPAATSPAATSPAATSPAATSPAATSPVLVPSPAPAPPASPPAALPAPSAPRPANDAPALAAGAPLPKMSSRRVTLERVSAARADTGELPEARTQLLRANERYVQCVESNGGLTGSPGSVTLRFLVRERGRAEGVTVKERAGLSMAAAKCVAAVVDRRFVGYPAAPIVGADLTIDFAWEGAGR